MADIVSNPVNFYLLGAVCDYRHFWIFAAIEKRYDFEKVAFNIGLPVGDGCRDGART